MVSLSAQACVVEGADPDAVLVMIRDRLLQVFGIDHCTIQVEREGLPESAIHD